MIQELKQFCDSQEYFKFSKIFVNKNEQFYDLVKPYQFRICCVEYFPSFAFNVLKY